MEEPINYNSMDLSSEKIFLYLSSGKRMPQNQFELDFLAECEEIIQNGGAIIIPHED